MLSRAQHAEFLQMIWAIDALQSGREVAARKALSRYPPEAVMESSFNSNFGIHRWELETLIVQYLLAPKRDTHTKNNNSLDCSQFDSIRKIINRLRTLEDLEAARYLSEDITIRTEMHRIAQRQFHWQRGYFNVPQIYRYAYLYAQGKCAEYFRSTHDIEITDLIFAGFGLFAVFASNPWVKRDTSLPQVGLTSSIVQKSLQLMSASIDETRAEQSRTIAKAQADHGSPIPTALLPSILRRTPIVYVSDLNNLISPIPEAILLRVSSGLYYDVSVGGQHIINDANDRFETYCADLINAMMDRLKADKAYRYGPKSAQLATPDILIRDHGKITCVAECKATKLTYPAQFAEDPFEVAKNQYNQIAKGVFQLWRFFSHIRQGLIEESLSIECSAVVITLDPFLLMAREPQDKVFSGANALADEYGNIAAEDRKPVSICSIADLESILSSATEDSFLASLRASTQDKYQGWMLSEEHKDTGATREFGEPRRYPFDLSKVLPWWSRFSTTI